MQAQVNLYSKYQVSDAGSGQSDTRTAHDSHAFFAGSRIRIICTDDIINIILPSYKSFGIVVS
jgi:hypothetical protein